jgi:hypothetical protein
MSVASSTKTLIVDVLIALPSYRGQQIAAAIVRRVWRGFRHA